MADLYLAAIIMALLSAAALALGLRFGRQLKPRAADGLAAAVVLGMLVCAFYLRRQAWMGWLLPFSSVVILADWTPLAGGVLAGLAWHRIPGGRRRKSVAVGALILLGLFPLTRSFLGEPPLCFDQWQDGVCLQTSHTSCSAAAAATLLALHGIPGTEEELARLCLTQRRGTTFFGVYRGLKLKTAGTPWDVEIVVGSPSRLSELRGPTILEVGLASTQGVDPRYHQEWGWQPGQVHCVVLLGFDGSDLVRIADPSVGREHWETDHLRVLWRGIGLRLRPRVARDRPNAAACP